MKTLARLFIIYLVLMGGTNCKNEKSDILYNKKYLDEIKAARKDIFLFMAQNNVPGGTFAIAMEGEIIYSEALGLASKDLNVPTTRNTKFRIGQVSELLTSLICHKMIENGTLHPDSTVQFYYPEFPEKQFRLSIRHLLNNTSGLREPTHEEKDWRGLNVSIQNGIDNFRNDSLVVSPGAFQSPNLFNYNLLGAVLESITKKPFPEILKEFVTDTLELNHTVIDNPYISIEGRSDFFSANFLSQVLQATSRDMRFRAPSEGILSNAEDLVKFGNALLFSDYFSEEIKKRMFEPVVLSTGQPSNFTNGWIIIYDMNDRKIYGKSGKVTGGGAALLIYPEEKIVAACAINMDINSEHYPVFDMAAHFL